MQILLFKDRFSLRSFFCYMCLAAISESFYGFAEFFMRLGSPLASKNNLTNSVKLRNNILRKQTFVTVLAFKDLGI